MYMCSLNFTDKGDCAVCQQSWHTSALLRLRCIHDAFAIGVENSKIHRHGGEWLHLGGLESFSHPA